VIKCGRVRQKGRLDVLDKRERVGERQEEVKVNREGWSGWK
jgi:hypothetical protein